ncbi:MAG TPA: M3 family metallopeptidase [Steroidobacteraceae bacterium]|nr:M3 family metallopeptidase [Steroidobacteraceae bacterium]
MIIYEDNPPLNVASCTPIGASDSELDMTLTINTRNLLNSWPGPFGGVPPFDRVAVSALQPALEAAMQEQLAELQVIANNPQPPTFANTIEALENSGRALDRVLTIYHVYSSTMNDNAMQEVEREMEPKLAAFHDAITQNVALFKRIAAVYDKREQGNLTAEQQRLCWLHYQSFARTGARLNDADKQTLSTINQRLAALYTQFSQNVLKDENDVQVVLDSETQLAGLPESEREAAASEAAARGLKGKWVIANTRSSVEPFLTYSTRRELREQVWRNFIHRGDHGATDNKSIVSEILALRARRAKLLGYETHAHWQLEDSMAKNPAAALQLLRATWKPAVQRVREEVADMQLLADKDGIKIEAWDYRFYAEQVRKERFNLDANELKPYLQLDKLREGMFFVASKLFGVKFIALGSVPVYHPDVSVFEVQNANDDHVGLWYFDPCARRGKQSGAWMSEYRHQEKFSGRISAIVSNNANFIKGKPNEPVLINWEDAVTLFHEFGHALHGLLSNVQYPSMSGTSVTRDFVEFPSQLLEHWLLTPEVLNRFALHYQTGRPMPQSLIDKIRTARNFNQGFATLEYLSSALIDMELHLAGEVDIDAEKFERDTLQQLGAPAEVVMRHRIPHFGHIFSGDGYAAGYYSYLWADTLVADAWEAFVESGDVFDSDIAARLRDHVFSAGNQQEPDIAYRAFRGRDADVQALMRKRGFV